MLAILAVLGGDFLSNQHTVGYRQVDRTLVGCRRTAGNIQEVVVTKQIALARTCSQVLAHQHITVLQGRNVSYRCCIGSTDKAHKGQR